MTGKVTVHILAFFRLSETLLPISISHQRSTIMKYITKSLTQIMAGFLAGFLLASQSIFACTIVSAVADDGQVWNANNEDGPKGVANFINVFPKSTGADYGYFTLSYLSPRFGNGANIQGGMNEAGLTFDFNAIDWVEDFDPDSRQPFPRGNDAILPHILATMDSVQEVIAFFNTYWFEDGFRGAQMHVADRYGRFAIISASGVQLVEKGESLVSTNFDICGEEDSSSCWRYPVATAELAKSGASLSTMMSICHKTAQKNGATMYSNVQNLTTGDVWFFSKHDPNVTVKVNINELLVKGRESYTFGNLHFLKEERDYQYVTPELVRVTDSVLQQYVGTYTNPGIGEVVVQLGDNELSVSFQDGYTAALHPLSKWAFYMPDEDVRVEFETDEHEDHLALSWHESGHWSFTARKSSSHE